MTSPTDLPGLPEVPYPVTFARLVAMLGDQGFRTDDSGSTLRRRSDEAEIAISIPAGDAPVLVVRGNRVGAPIPTARLHDLEAFVNDWHRERIWPTMVLTRADDQVAVHGHVGIDATAGLTDIQLREYLRIGIGTMYQCFRALADAPGVGSGESPADPSADPDPR